MSHDNEFDPAAMTDALAALRTSPVGKRNREELILHAERVSRDIGRREKAMARPRKIGRNHPCPCGSGRKYKRCCIRRGRP